VKTAAEAAAALKPLAGSFASLLFTLGIVGTGLLAVPVLAGSTAYAITEAVGQPEGLGRSVGRARVFYGVIAAAMLLGLGMDFVGLDPVRALYFAAILNGLAAPPLILLMLLLSRTRDGVRGSSAGADDGAPPHLPVGALRASVAGYAFVGTRSRISRRS